MRGRVAALVAVVAIASAPSRGRAEDPPPSPAPATDDLARAKDLFRSGLALLDAGDLERALDHFERSRALVPGKGNTVNVAVCLDRLGRYDEALEAYEDVLTRHAGQLAPEDRASIAPAMRALRSKIGSLEISANVDGAVVVDARARGKLPRTTPLRLLAGSHVVRVLKDGYASCEAHVEIVAGATASTDCQLALLAEAGQLRLEDPSNPGASVFVDGALVGAAPWEGALSPGPHVVWIQKDGRGTGPSRAFVVKGQTALIRLASQPLGPVATIDVEPPTAELAIDDVAVGGPRWRGALPRGPRRIAANEAGYVARRTTLVEPDASGDAPKMAIRLAIDPTHPRWPRSTGSPIVGVFGGPAFGGGFGGDAEATCPSGCSRKPRSLGVLVGARAGFRFPMGLSLELDAGYLRAETSFSRTIATNWGVPGKTYRVVYSLEDDIAVRGPFLGGTVGVRGPVKSRVALVARTTIGAWITGSTDPIMGTATAGRKTAAIVVSEMDERLTSVALLLMPELGLDVKLGPVLLGASLAVAFVPTGGPSFHHPWIEVPPVCPATNPTVVGCAPASRAVAGERAYAHFLLFVPQIAATMVF